jgi:hypothetical protein
MVADRGMLWLLKRRVILTELGLSIKECSGCDDWKELVEKRNLGDCRD